MSVLLFYKCFFSVERGDIIRFFEIVNSKKKKKRCKYNSINYIETIKKENQKYFCEGVGPRQFDALWEGGEGMVTKSVRRRKDTPLPGRPRGKVRTLFSSFCLCDRPKNCIRVIPAY